jgi:hypothetical protein
MQTVTTIGLGADFIKRKLQLARPLPNRLVKTALILATILVVAALGLDFIAPLFLDS